MKNIKDILEAMILSIGLTTCFAGIMGGLAFFILKSMDKIPIGCNCLC
jgi:hypothetical protein